MTDLTQPASAAEFMAAGVDEATATSLAAQHNTAAGRNGFNAMAEARETFRNQPPPPTPATPPPTTNAQLSEAATAHQDAQLADSFAALWQPPANPWDYKFPESIEPQTDESMATDNSIKEALHRAGVPDWAGNSVFADIAQGSRALAKDPSQANALLDSTTARLSSVYGDASDAKIATVAAYLDELQRDPALKDAIARARPVIATNFGTFDTILQIAEHRAGKR